MDSGNQHIIQLLERFSRGTATAAETDQLLNLLQQDDRNEELVNFMMQQMENFQPDNADDIAYWKEKLKDGAARITGHQQHEMNTTATPVHRIHFLRRRGWGWAAAVVAVLGIGSYVYITNNKSAEQPVVTVAAHITPGKNGAVLTLADGSQVVLDSLGNGIVATQNGTAVTLKSGELSYSPGSITEGETVYNTMTTPRGRQFQLTLPDGTRVWLNAASSLRYPVSFSGNERLVQITGEAYFEVAANSKMPFKVNVNDKATIEVLGTHFNVNAYNNESTIQTTLLNGAVRVGGRNNTAQLLPLTLKPGQQARINNQSAANGISLVKDVDISKVISWKNGIFNFEGASLGEIMRQLERWYDIEVVYEKGIPKEVFEGKVTKGVPLKDVLMFLERDEIHFRLEGRKLTVLP